jgi:hypothetical protein
MRPVRYRAGLLDGSEGHNLDEIVGVGKPSLLNDCSGRCRAAKILLLEVGIFRELVRIGNIGAGCDDVSESCPCHFQAGLDLLANQLQLCPHVALADYLAGVVAGGLGTDDHPVTAAAQRDERRRRRIAAGRTENCRLRQVLDRRPACIRLFDEIGGVLASVIHRLGHVREIELAVDNSPGLGIDRVLVRHPDPHCAVAVVLRAVAVRILSE